MTVTVFEKVLLWLREHDADGSNAELYAAFPTIPQSTLKTYKSRYKKGHNPRINPNPRVTESNAVTVTHSTQSAISDNTYLKISVELVEKWILTRDSRAELGMRFLQYKDKFAIEDENDEHENEEFAQLMQAAEHTYQEEPEDENNEFDDSEFDEEFSES